MKALHCSCNETTEIKTSSASIISINNSNSVKTLATARTELNKLVSQKLFVSSIVTQATSRLLHTRRDPNICTRIHTLSVKNAVPALILSPEC